MAYCGFGATALIIQQIVLYVLINFVLWFSVKWRPSFSIFNKSISKSLRPGIKMMASNIIIFSQLHLPRLLISPTLGMESVGYYSFITRIQSAAHEILVTPACTPLFPMLVKLNDNQDLRKQLIYSFFIIISLIYYPILMLSILTAPQYIPLVFGKSWSGAALYLEVFMFVGFFTPITAIVTVILRASNAGGWVLFLNLGSASVSLLFILLFYRYGFMSLIIGIVASQFLIALLYSVALRCHSSIDIFVFCRDLWASPLALAAMAIPVILLVTHPQFNSQWINLFASLFLGVSAFVVISVLLQRRHLAKFIAFACSLRTNSH
jgi:O-antigen/teichoic acid export membrane protein